MLWEEWSKQKGHKCKGPEAGVFWLFLRSSMKLGEWSEEEKEDEVVQVRSGRKG